MSPALTIHAAVPERHVQVDIEVPAGRVLAVLGANGAGKSTVLALAAGLVRPERGTVTIGGHEVAGGRWVPPHRRKIALLAQEPLLLPHRTCWRMSRSGPGRRAWAAGRPRRLPGRDCARWVPTTWLAAGPENSPGASNNGWRWPGRWRRILNCCCSMNRWRRWTCKPPPIFGNYCAPPCGRRAAPR